MKDGERDERRKGRMSGRMTRRRREGYWTSRDGRMKDAMKKGKDGRINAWKRGKRGTRMEG